MPVYLILILIFFIIILPAFGAYNALKKGRKTWAIIILLTALLGIGWLLAIITFFLKPSRAIYRTGFFPPSKKIFAIATSLISIIIFFLLILTGGNSAEDHGGAPKLGRNINTSPAVVALNGSTISSICLSISYPQMLPMFDTMSSDLSTIFNRSGIAVSSNQEECDAILEIVLVGTALSGQYGVAPVDSAAGKNCFEGAEATGRITLIPHNNASVSYEIKGVFEPRSAISQNQCNIDPADAPYHQAWQGAVLNGLAEIWGTDMLIQALGTGPNMELYLQAVKILQEKPDAIEKLINALNDGDELVRRQSAEALGKMPESGKAIEALITSLNQDESYTVRANAATTLSQIDMTEEIVNALVKALDDPNEYVRNTVIDGLGRIGTLSGGVSSPFAQVIIPALTDIQDNDSSSGVSSNARSALNCINFPSICEYR